MTQDHPAQHILRITVRGRISDRVAAGLDGMQVTNRGATTELVGRLLDQAQLHGLLNRIRDLGLDLESALVIDCPDPITATQSNDTPPRP